MKTPRQVVVELRNGNIDEAFESMKERYVSFIQNFTRKFILTGCIRGLDAEDFKQEMYIEMIRVSKKVDVSKHDSQIDYMFKVSLNNKALHMYRSQYSKCYSADKTASNPIDNCASIDAKLSTDENDCSISDFIEDKSQSNIVDDYVAIENYSNNLSEEAKKIIKAIIQEVPSDSTNNEKIKSLFSLCKYMKSKCDIAHSKTINIIAKEVEPFIKEFYGINESAKSKSIRRSSKKMQICCN